MCPWLLRQKNVDKVYHHSTYSAIRVTITEYPTRNVFDLVKFDAH